MLFMRVGYGYGFERLGFPSTLRVQVPDNHILTHNLRFYCYKPKYLIVGYLDPLSKPYTFPCFRVPGFGLLEALGRYGNFPQSGNPNMLGLGCRRLNSGTSKKGTLKSGTPPYEYFRKRGPSYMHNPYS